MRLTKIQREALKLGRVDRWLGAAEVGVQGNTMQALAGRGLAEVRRVVWPHERLVYRLTSEGAAARHDELRAAGQGQR